VSNPSPEFFREQGRKGGKLSAKARMKNLTPEERSEIAKKAAAARWGKKPKKA
jgi:general stress protein YciG